MVIIGSDPIPTPPRYDRRDNGPVEAWLRMRPDRLPDAALVREKVLGMLRGIDHEILRVRERIRLCEVEIRERQAEREALRLVLEQALDDERIDALKRQSVAPAPKQARRRKAK